MTNHFGLTQKYLQSPLERGVGSPTLQSFSDGAVCLNIKKPFLRKSYHYHLAASDSSQPPRKYPDPHKVLYRSLMIPGWGQIINKQVYKVPIIYLLLGGLTYYSIYLTKEYHDYRAAYYNLNSESPNDFRFGPTPPYLKNANPSFLKRKRNTLHNRRDFIYITIVLAYGLNALDAYIFAQLRSFNVSKNLSVRTSIKPGMIARATPGITVSFSLFRSKN